MIQQESDCPALVTHRVRFRYFFFFYYIASITRTDAPHYYYYYFFFPQTSATTTIVLRWPRKPSAGRRKNARGKRFTWDANAGRIDIGAYFRARVLLHGNKTVERKKTKIIRYTSIINGRDCINTMHSMFVLLVKSKNSVNLHTNCTKFTAPFGRNITTYRHFGTRLPLVRSNLSPNYECIVTTSIISPRWPSRNRCSYLSVQIK